MHIKPTNKDNLKVFFLIVLSLCSLNLTSQSISKSEILKISDSIVIANTNSHLFKFFTSTEGSYYRYKNREVTKIGKFDSSQKLRNEIQEIWVHYKFNHPEINGVSNGLWVKLDENLKLIEPLDLIFIPEFLWKNQSSNFISKEKAKQIAISKFRNKGIKIDDAELMYNEKSKSYVYIIFNKLNEIPNSANQPSGSTEVIKVDAITGKIVERFDGIYGLIIR